MLLSNLLMPKFRHKRKNFRRKLFLLQSLDQFIEFQNIDLSRQFIIGVQTEQAKIGVIVFLKTGCSSLEFLRLMGQRHVVGVVQIYQGFEYSAGFEPASKLNYPQQPPFNLHKIYIISDIMSSTYKLLVLIFALWLSQSAYVLNKLLVTDPLAQCLDGSAVAYYIHPGDKSRFVINFEGGGWCGDSRGVSQTLESCYQRSKTTLGSSSQYPSSISFSQGILSDSSTNLYKGRTMVFLKYCTGTGHQGYKKDPIDYKGKKLYFRGQYATIGQLNAIDKLYKLFNATEIIVTGQSAGGLAAMLWANYIASKSLNTTKVLCLADSGIFLDQQNMITRNHDFRQGFINFMSIANLDADPPTAECVRANPGQKWKCLFAQYLYQYLKVPLFPIQSLYDSASLIAILGLNCESGGSLVACSQAQRGYIEKYKRNTTDLMQNIRGWNARNGGWGIACAKHVFTLGSEFYSSYYVVPAGSGVTIEYAVLLWQSNNRADYFVDKVSWPDNVPCSGVQLSIQE